MLDTNYIQGSHSVHIKPPTIAQLNSEKISYCLHNSGALLNLPITIKGTPPYKIILNATHFETGKVEQLEKLVTAADALKQESKRINLLLLLLRINSTKLLLN